MVNYCRVNGCHNRQNREKHLQYYRLPKVIKNQGEDCKKLSEERRNRWLAALQQDFTGKTLDNIRVCSAHFTSGKKASLYSRDNPDWVPSVGMSTQDGTPIDARPAAKRFERRQNRTKKKKKNDISAAESPLLLSQPQSSDSPTHQEPEDFNSKGQSIQTDLSVSPAPLPLQP